MALNYCKNKELGNAWLLLWVSLQWFRTLLGAVYRAVEGPDVRIVFILLINCSTGYTAMYKRLHECFYLAKSIIYIQRLKNMISNYRRMKAT